MPVEKINVYVGYTYLPVHCTVIYVKKIGDNQVSRISFTSRKVFGMINEISEEVFEGCPA